MTGIGPTESQIQQAVIAWCRLQSSAIRYTVHAANEGKRSPIMGARLKREGMIPGVSDLFVPLPVVFASGHYAGLWLELKRHGGKLTDQQWAWGMAMQAAGYAFAWADSVEGAIAAIQAYARGVHRRPEQGHTPMRVVTATGAVTA